jgi:hypothetical protein
MDICVYVYSVPVFKQRPCDVLITRTRSPTDCAKKDYQTKEEASAQQNAVETLMNE